MKLAPSAFTVALQFLTVLPVTLTAPPSPTTAGRSLLAYPWVGGIVGGLLVGLVWLLSSAPPLLVAGLLLALWVAVTGALHLDGLADSADGWLGGLGDRNKTLLIMHDPTCGSAAVVTLVIVLLLKWAALAALLSAGSWMAIGLAPIVGRAAAVALLASTPYARTDGIGTALSQHLPQTACRWLLAVVALLTLWLGGLPVLLVVLATIWLLRRAVLRRLGGTTGDTAGALVELTELAVLITTALAV